MTTQALLDFCMAKTGAWADCPFGPEPICVRIGKRIFAEIFPGRSWVTLKCEPVYGLAMRARYPQAVRRGYHCPVPQHPYNNTVTLDGSVPGDTLLEMIDHSYRYALGNLTRAQREEALRRRPDGSTTQ